MAWHIRMDGWVGLKGGWGYMMMLCDDGLVISLLSYM